MAGFLRAAQHEVIDMYALAYVQRAHALGRVNLMPA